MLLGLDEPPRHIDIDLDNNQVWRVTICLQWNVYNIKRGHVRGSEEAFYLTFSLTAVGPYDFADIGRLIDPKVSDAKVF